MSAGALISVDEYLNTSYDLELEYVDGALVERHVGDWLHSLVQRNLIVALTVKYPHIYAVPEFRSQTTDTRYRLPDVCVLLTAPVTSYLAEAAFLAIEILSKDDGMPEMLEQLEEYELKGVRNIWLVDPRRRKMYVYADGALTEVRGDAIFTGDRTIELHRGEIFKA
jgi:Uma2 family endonuclease